MCQNTVAQDREASKCEVTERCKRELKGEQVYKINFLQLNAML